MKIEKTIEKLEDKVRAARPSMKPTKKMIYSNEDTGTVIYEVSTDNRSMDGLVTEWRLWKEYLVGNLEGHSYGGFHLASEASIGVKEVEEDENEVRIRRSGYMSSHFGIRLEAEDLTFDKEDFKPYS
jgi:hypothetical protein